MLEGDLVQKIRWIVVLVVTAMVLAIALSLVKIVTWKPLRADRKITPQVRFGEVTLDNSNPKTILINTVHTYSPRNQKIVLTDAIIRNATGGEWVAEVHLNPEVELTLNIEKEVAVNLENELPTGEYFVKFYTSLGYPYISPEFKVDG